MMHFRILATKTAKKNRRKRKDKKTTPISTPQPKHFAVSPSRKIIGFVSSGDFLFSTAQGGGICFVSIAGLIDMVQVMLKAPWIKTKFKSRFLNDFSYLCMMRNVDSDFYKYAILKLC